MMNFKPFYHSSFKFGWIHRKSQKKKPRCVAHQKSSSTVMDMNDNPPKFEQSSYSCSLSQHAVRGQFVTIVSASDPDYIDADNLIYSIAEGNELQTYAIDPISGIITLINMQNFAENHSTILNISVSDSVYTSFIRVQINILPANLHNPVFPHLVYDVKINENQMAGRLVITVSLLFVYLAFRLGLNYHTNTHTNSKIFCEYVCVYPICAQFYKII